MRGSPEGIPLSLAGLRPGQRGRIKEYTASDPDLLRLKELGLVPGQEIEFLKIAPLGDPIEVRIMDYDLCLRKSDADRIPVEPLS